MHTKPGRLLSLWAESQRSSVAPTPPTLGSLHGIACCALALAMLILSAPEPRAALHVTLSDGPKAFELVVNVTGVAGESVRLESSADGAAWSTLATGTFDLTGRFQTSISTLAGPMRILRAVAHDGPPVYSDNAVAYVAASLPPGWSLLANPLLAADNTMPALFPDLPPG